MSETTPSPTAAPANAVPTGAAEIPAAPAPAKTKGKAKATEEVDPAAQPDPEHFERPTGGGSWERQKDGTLVQVEGPASDRQEEA